MGQSFITLYGWHSALLILAGFALLIIPLAGLIPHTESGAGEMASQQTLSQALREASSHPDT